MKKKENSEPSVRTRNTLIHSRLKHAVYVTNRFPPDGVPIFNRESKLSLETFTRPWKDERKKGGRRKPVRIPEERKRCLKGENVVGFFRCKKRALARLCASRQGLPSAFFISLISELAPTIIRLYTVPCQHSISAGALNSAIVTPGQLR